jgi:hypothetical protein
MISEVTARHYGFTILPSDVRIKSTNNAVTAVIGTTDMVTVDIQGHSCHLTLVVLKHDDHDVLLGLDWFMATGASLHPKSHTLQFPGTVVQLHSPHHSDDIYSCNAEDDCILSVSVADEDDISPHSKIMYQAIGDLGFVKIYLDDITIHSSTFELHHEHVSTVLERLNKANLKLNCDKSTWFSQEVSLLGHIVNTSGIHMDPKKVHAIQAMLPPTNVKQVQQFLGICNYYRKFIANFAKMSEPIAELVKKEIPFI